MKAILVIDVPNDFETKTAIAIVDVKNEKGEGVTAMCPIKPIPEKIEMTNYEDLGSIMFRNGWNKCIYTILGEEDD